jgi:hypothetical protein
MGFFSNIYIKENKTGNLIDITNLDKEHYESFLELVVELNKTYKYALKDFNTKQLINFLKK